MCQIDLKNLIEIQIRFNLKRFRHVVLCFVKTMSFVSKQKITTIIFSKVVIILSINFIKCKINFIAEICTHNKNLAHQ